MKDARYRITTVGQALQYYMEHKGFNAKSWQTLSSMTKVFIQVMGAKKLRDLNPDHFKAYTAARRSGVIGTKKAKSIGTISRELRHLTTAINYCSKSRLIDPDDVPYIPIPNEPPPRDRWLQKDEIQLLRDAAVPGSRADIFINIVLATGSRKRVVEKLEWSQVNFTTNMIEFGKGQDVITNKRRPTVPIQSDLLVYLQELKKKSTSDYVLGTSGDISKAFKYTVKRAGLENVTPHVLRHTWATHASMNGVSLLEIARVLGDSILTVQKVYAKFQPEYLKDAIERAAL